MKNIKTFDGFCLSESTYQAGMPIGAIMSDAKNEAEENVERLKAGDPPQEIVDALADEGWEFSHDMWIQEKRAYYRLEDRSTFEEYDNEPIIMVDFDSDAVTAGLEVGMYTREIGLRIDISKRVDDLARGAESCERIIATNVAEAARQVLKKAREVVASSDMSNTHYFDSGNPEEIIRVFRQLYDSDPDLVGEGGLGSLLGTGDAETIIRRLKSIKRGKQMFGV